MSAIRLFASNLYLIDVIAAKSEVVGGARFTGNAMDYSALPIVKTLRLETVHLVLTTEVSLLLIEGADWRPDGLEGGVHDELGLWEVDLDLLVLLINTIGEIDDEVVVQHW